MDELLLLQSENIILYIILLSIKIIFKESFW